MFEGIGLEMIAGLIATGVAVGLVAGLLGVGGGILMVPVFYLLNLYVYHLTESASILLAVGTSLACMVPTSISSVMAQHKKNNIDWSLIKGWFVSLLAGVICGALLSAFKGGTWLTGLFGCIAMFVALRMFLGAKKEARFKSLPGVIWQHVAAFFISFLSVMVGIGGGSLTTPYLTAFNVPIHKAVGTAATVGLIICLPGAIMGILFADTPAAASGMPGVWSVVNWLQVLFIVPCSVMFAKLGVALGAKMNQVLLKRIFAVVLFCTAARMLYSAFV